MERARLELLLAGGASQNAVARKFKLHPDCVSRHWAGHVSEERKAALIVGPVQREALAARVSEESESILDHFRVVRAALYELFATAVTAGDRTSGAMLAGRLHENLNAIAKLTGELIQSPLIQNNVQNNFLLLPEFATFQADLIRVLSKFPDARAAVIEAFERFESTAAPALEHQRAPSAAG